MLSFTLDTDDMMHVARHFSESFPRKTKAALAFALNKIGEEIIQETVDIIVDQTKMNPDDVRRLISVVEAEPDALEWDMDATAIAPPSMDWSRPWDAPRETSAIDVNQMVRIVNWPIDDDSVCKICRDLADGGPYSMYEAQHLIPAHPNCRCGFEDFKTSQFIAREVMDDYSAFRKMPVTFGTAPPQLMTMRKLGQEVARAMSVQLSIKD